jgi:hypothetical protein
MNALDPNKIQLCRLGEHNEEAQRMGQPCGCVGNCQLGWGQVTDEMRRRWRLHTVRMHELSTMSDHRLIRLAFLVLGLDMAAPPPAWDPLTDGNLSLELAYKIGMHTGCEDSVVNAWVPLMPAIFVTVEVQPDQTVHAQRRAMTQCAALYQMAAESRKRKVIA